MQIWISLAKISVVCTFRLAVFALLFCFETKRRGATQWHFQTGWACFYHTLYDLEEMDSGKATHRWTHLRVKPLCRHPTSAGGTKVAHGSECCYHTSCMSWGPMYRHWVFTKTLCTASFTVRYIFMFGVGTIFMVLVSWWHLEAIQCNYYHYELVYEL